MESEREERARVEVKYDKVLKRVGIIEEILGIPISLKKPKFVL
jgi:hypothetical protein